MRISSFRVKNYKSFIDSGEIKLSPGFNLIVGPNNTGKTALLEALSLAIEAKPHRSPITKPNRSDHLEPESVVEITYVISGDEFKNIVYSNLNNILLYVPSSEAIGYRRGSEIKLFEDLVNKPTINLKMRGIFVTGKSVTWEPLEIPSYGIHTPTTPTTNNYRFYKYNVSPDKSNINYITRLNSTKNEDIGVQLAPIISQMVYSFHAERMNVGSSGPGTGSELLPNASNLPVVLHSLMTNNPGRFNRLIDLVRKIFPSVYAISVRMLEHQGFEIIISIVDPKEERDDLNLALSVCGTGIGQVISILYVVINSDFPRTIIIDEPNSFLHPGAARILIEILKEFPQHQFIVSTHSPEIVRSSNPSTVNLIKYMNYQSEIESLDIGQIEDTKRCLVEVGAKLSDVFGADRILWVEGSTEEACFPIILNKYNKVPLLTDTSILAVKNTGDLMGKKKKIILDIYNKLSVGNALLPRAVAFILDREGLNEEDIGELESESNGLMKFLPRRTYENYLLHPSAISAVTSKIDSFNKMAVSTEKIDDWLKGKGKEFVDDSDECEVYDNDWYKKVNGAKLLENLFDDLSNNTDIYRKTIHSYQLTKWLLENKKEELRELFEFIEGALQESPTP